MLSKTNITLQNYIMRSFLFQFIILTTLTYFEARISKVYNLFQIKF